MLITKNESLKDKFEYHQRLVESLDELAYEYTPLNPVEKAIDNIRIRLRSTDFGTGTIHNSFTCITPVLIGNHRYKYDNSLKNKMEEKHNGNY